MVISKPPKARKAAAERFIEGAPDAGAAEAPANIPAPTRQKKETISLGLDPALLARADAAAVRFGVSRAALIAMALTRFVDSEQ
ncbi:CopG family transcriptional regulator [Burkholderia gladioli]|uniref:CopG family transcriptional regulator n=1 Tax=Burkholderia gladioli TaxID=28095 RepID=UPI001641FED4|nr:CopG family transcriptional regulator [Burkholderia gladioli]